MRWKIQLEGHKEGLELLSESFGEDPRIFEEDGEYYLWSSEFKECDKSVEVQDIGENIVRMVRNLGELDTLRVNNLDTYRVVEIQEDGSERRIVHASGSLTGVAAVSARGSTEGEKLPPRAESTYEYTQLALKDPKLKELVELRDKGDYWVNLYRIYEYIEDNIGPGQNIVEQGWWSKSEEKLFTYTANSSEAIGHEARHAETKEGKPSDGPIDHAEAKSLIENLINNWLRHRKNIQETSGDEN